MVTVARALKYKMMINGQWVESSLGRYFDSINPATGEVWAEIPVGETEDIDLAVKAAKKALEDPQWKRISPMKRGNMLRRLGDLIRENIEYLASVETRDNGKLIKETRSQISELPDYYYYFAGLADKIQGDTIPLENPDIFNYTLREPLGVIAIITPWNSPLNVLSFSLPVALATGNTVVIKPSEHTSASTLELARLAEKAGFPPGVINVVTGFGKTAGASLAAHPDVAKVVFTGGRETGKSIAGLAANHLTRTLLELGGKSPNIIFDDAVIPNALARSMAGIFSASGQSCVAGSRLFLQDKIHDEFVERLIERTKRIKVGDPLDSASQMGPIATTDQLKKVETFVDIAKNDGATLVCGGARPDDPSLGKGWFYLPTVFANVKNEMFLAQEEVFGPVLSVLKFHDEEEIIKMANDTPYGLGAGIWTRDIQRAHRIAREIKSGSVWINMYRALSYASPFGGYKQSGYGREMGLNAIHEFTQVKSVWVELSGKAQDPYAAALKN